MIKPVYNSLAGFNFAFAFKAATRSCRVFSSAGRSSSTGASGFFAAFGAVDSFRDGILALPLANPREAIFTFVFEKPLEAIFFFVVENLREGIFAMSL
jgi:hypothetical protein